MLGAIIFNDGEEDILIEVKKDDASATQEKGDNPAPGGSKDSAAPVIPEKKTR